MGGLEGLFIAKPSDIQNTIGKVAYFGEVLGKHSEIFSELNEDHFELITDDTKVIDIIWKFDLTSGFNPLEYIEEKEDNNE